jgi:hypothetical protein
MTVQAASGASSEGRGATGGIGPMRQLRISISVIVGILASVSVAAVALAEGVNGPLPR